MCFVWISEQTAIISLYSINLPVFKTQAESVYCAVRNGSLNQTDTVSYLRVNQRRLPAVACCVEWFSISLRRDGFVLSPLVSIATYEKTEISNRYG